MPDHSISVAEAAMRLRVNQTRVRAMIAAGLLDAVKVGGRWLIDVQSVERRKDRTSPVGRPFSPAKAWGLLLVAAGERPDWLSRWDLSRIRRRLREQGLGKLVPKLRSRAVLHRLRAHPSDTERIAAGKNVVMTGISAAYHHGLDLVTPGQVEFYLPVNFLDRLSKKYALQPSDRPNLLIRVVGDLWPFEKNCSVAPASVVGVDLVDSDDARTRRAGLWLLEQVEKQWSI
jgi:excisionase family DNA binding protein